MQQADNSNLNVQVTYFKAPPSEETPIEEDKFISPFILSSQLVFEGAACAEAAVENQPAPTSTSTAKKALFEGRLPVTVKSFALEGDSVQMVNALAATEFLLKEAEKMMELKHPRLVKLLGVLMDSVGLIVFEFMANGSLKEFIQRHATNSIPLAWSVRHQLAKDVAEGLSFLHSSSPPVFHQGLTSETVLLTMEGAILRAKISDAGLVDVKLRAAKEDTSGFASSVAACPMIMNRHYTAPELFRGNKKFNTAQDIYAFGVVMLELCLLEKASFAFKKYPKNVRQDKNIPASFKTVLDLSLGFEPDSRPTADILFAMIRNYDSALKQDEDRKLLKEKSTLKSSISPKIAKKSTFETSPALPPTIPKTPPPMRLPQSPPAGRKPPAQSPLPGSPSAQPIQYPKMKLYKLNPEDETIQIGESTDRKKPPSSPSTDRKLRPHSEDRINKQILSSSSHPTDRKRPSNQKNVSSPITMHSDQRSARRTNLSHPPSKLSFLDRILCRSAN